MATGRIGKDSVKIAYHSPGVRGRIIWGGLVPMDEVWVTGAHDATHIIIDKDFMMGGKYISAGKYALFTIPGKDSWTVILNKRWNQHLTNEYDSTEDLVRIQVKPQPNAHTERLQYFIEPITDSKGNIAIAWEKVKVSFPIQLKNDWWLGSCV